MIAPAVYLTPRTNTVRALFTQHFMRSFSEVQGSTSSNRKSSSHFSFLRTPALFLSVRSCYPPVPAHLLNHADIGSISRASFTKLIPFYVVEQSLRCCICVHCYRDKFVTITLCELWPDLHWGATTGSSCDCQCDLCRDFGCATFLPYAGPNAVSSWGA